MARGRTFYSNIFHLALVEDCCEVDGFISLAVGLEDKEELLNTPLRTPP